MHHVHPAIVHSVIANWWRAQRAASRGGAWHETPVSCGPAGMRDGRSCGPSGDWGDGGEGGGGDGGGGFGVRRPLRFLAHKLELDDKQIAALARVLDELKTERAQAEVDRRRTVAAFADAVSGDAFDDARASEGGALRVASAERLRGAVVRALQQIHAVLDAQQRAKLAYLIRTGTLAI